MGRTTAAARINLSIASDLKERMNKIVVKPNWSALMRPHLETECALRERGVRPATIQRLRVSKLQADQKLLAQGRIDGRAWVDGTDEYEGNAEYEALKKTAGQREPISERPRPIVGAAEKRG
jgi:hypothetical protein